MQELKEINEYDDVYYSSDENNNSNDNEFSESDNEVSDSDNEVSDNDNEVSESNNEVYDSEVSNKIQYIIYVIKNIINDKVFIDSTVNYKKYEGNLIKWSAEQEFEQHKKNLKRKTKDNLYPLLYSDMKEHGIDNFIVDVLEICSEFDYLNKLNKYKKEFDSENENFGYNIGHKSVKGIIYLITNIKNNKKYVGQTKNFKKIKNYIKIWTAEDRFNEHKKNTTLKSFKDRYRLLYDAMREYGIENFTVETIEICDINETGKLEQYYIKKYGSNDSKIGYNIQSGGNVNHKLVNGKRKTNMTDELRKKLSKTNNETTNITGIEYKGKIVGYRVRIAVDTQKFEKRFSSQKNTLEENFNSAKEFLEKVKNKENVDDIRLNNKSNELPLNIFLKKRKGENIGYEFNITLDGKRHYKSFCSTKISMEEKLKMVIDYKNNFLK